MSQTARIAKYGSPELKQAEVQYRPFESLSQSDLTRPSLDTETQKFAHQFDPTTFGATIPKEYPQSASKQRRHNIDQFLQSEDEDVALGQTFAKELSGHPVSRLERFASALTCETANNSSSLSEQRLIHQQHYQQPASDMTLDSLLENMANENSLPFDSSLYSRDDETVRGTGANNSDHYLQLQHESSASQHGSAQVLSFGMFTNSLGEEQQSFSHESILVSATLMEQLEAESNLVSHEFDLMSSQGRQRRLSAVEELPPAVPMQNDELPPAQPLQLPCQDSSSTKSVDMEKETVVLSPAIFTQINLKAKEESLCVREITQNVTENAQQLPEVYEADLGAKEEQRFDIRETSCAVEENTRAKGENQRQIPKKTPKVIGKISEAQERRNAIRRQKRAALRQAKRAAENAMETLSSNQSSMEVQESSTSEYLVSGVKSENIGAIFEGQKDSEESMEGEMAGDGQKQLYRCKYCNEAWTEPNKLGGHISKSHPGASSSYKSKVQTRVLRANDREAYSTAKKIISEFVAPWNLTLDDCKRQWVGRVKKEILEGQARPDLTFIEKALSRKSKKGLL